MVESREAMVFQSVCQCLDRHRCFLGDPAMGNCSTLLLVLSHWHPVKGYTPAGVISLESICLSKSNISYSTIAPQSSIDGVVNAGYRVLGPTWVVSTGAANSACAGEWGSDRRGCCRMRR